MKTSLRYRNKIDICERLHEPRLYKMSKVFPLASTELDLAKSERWGSWGGGESQSQASCLLISCCAGRQRSV